DSLIDDEEEPILKETIELNGKTLLIDDFSDIQKEFKDYINTKWIDDLITYKTEYSNYEKEYEIFESYNNVYKSFFRIYNKAQQFGEEYELIVGVGLLNFKENDETPKIFRHVFTQRVEINFEYSEKDSQIIINPTVESSPQIESDSIIDLVEQFDSQNIIDAEREIEKYINEKGLSQLFYDGLIKDAIQIFADRFSPDGRFIDKIDKPVSIEKKPTLFYSPALLLRKRNTRSFTALYENILSRIEDEPEEIEIPTIDDLIDLEDSPRSESNGIDADYFVPKFETIYFPKEHNEEQKEIIEKASRNNKVLVQGPPGTGKSHTIANLICHLLATGNKVLITAHTKRALEVLKDKLPNEFQNLAVNLLSGDSSSINDLQASVNAISDELSRGNINQYTKEINELNIDLESTREKIATITNELIVIKEKSVRKQEIFKDYSGTLTEIAEKIEKESSKFSWYTDLYSNTDDIEILEDLKHFFELNNLYSQIDLTEFDKWLPNIENLPSVKEIAHYRNAKENQFELISDDKSEEIKCDDYHALKVKLEEIQELYNKFESKESKLIQGLLDSYINGSSYLWHHKIEQSAKILSKIQEVNLEELKYNVKVNYNSNKDWISLKNDAKVLLEYLNQGNKLSGKIFKVKKAFLPKEINEKLYFIESIRVNGSPCDTKNEFEQVISDIELKQDFQELSDIWETDIIPKSSSYDKKFLFFKNYHNEAIKLISILDKFVQKRSEIEPIIKQQIEPFDKSQIKQLIQNIESSHLHDIIENSEKLISNAEKYLKQPNSHPITDKIVTQLQQIDPISYELALKELNTINEGICKYQEFKQLELKLQEKIPNLVDKILSKYFVSSQLTEFPDALRYKFTKNRINQLFDINYEKKLFIDLKDSEKREKQLIAKIASKLAWKYVIEGLQNNRALRQYLEAWVQAVKRIGKTGKGKRALKFRKEAQIQME
ncbi:MAG: AAA domain-containing protein, partial [Cyclobacteriaceae bacterium]